MAITAFLWLICITVSIPVLVLAIECIVGSFASSRRPVAYPVPPVSVLMPAHDEASGIARTIGDVIAQLRLEDELIVIADNCSDDTALIAERLGATVIVRDDPERRGKGYALQFGRAHIASGPDRVVIVLDADCSPRPHAIHRLAAMAAKHDAVVQGADLLKLPAAAGPMVRLSCFAFLVKNLVRQLALRRLAGTALLQGTGMAFPHHVFSRLHWPGQSLVEDLELGLELLIGGERVLFDETALFLSEASSEKATVEQRRRWEHGALQSMGRFVPRLIRTGLAGRPRLLVVALDQLVPPTVLLIVASGVLTLLLIVLAGTAAPVMLLLAAFLSLGTGLTVAWIRHGRALVPPRMLSEAVRYIAWKIPIAFQFLTRRERNWIRTERGP